MLNLIKMIKDRKEAKRVETNEKVAKMVWERVFVPRNDQGLLTLVSINNDVLTISTECPIDNDNMTGLAIVTTISGTTVVITGKKFNELSDKAKEFAIQHELGHVAHNVFGMNFDVDIEGIADDYAVSKVGKDAAIEGLKEMRFVIENYRFVLLAELPEARQKALDLIDRRIERLA